ncbi:MAG: DUF2993 domain-containing protein [Cyanosarcina radialis HA8281-LM2]|jgi:hypothetical protein|nr:DUF2993 domain-containing protein [Cyanosarcina radialis HA8281-LM2]
MSDEPRIEEQMLSQLAKSQLEDRLDRVTKLDVDLHTNLLDIVQGKVNSAVVSGQGLVLNRDIRIEEIEIQTEEVGINPLNAIFNKVELNNPVNARVRMVLREEDLNSILNSDDVDSQLPPLELEVDDCVVRIDLQRPLQLHLPDNRRMIFQGNALLQKTSYSQLVGFTAVICPRTRHQPLLVEEFRCHDGQGIPLELTATLMQKFKDLLELPYYKWDEILFQVREMYVEPGSLIAEIDLRIEDLPIRSE